MKKRFTDEQIFQIVNEPDRLAQVNILLFATIIGSILGLTFAWEAFVLGLIENPGQ